MSIEHVFDLMARGKKKRGSKDEIDPNWIIIEKDGSVRYAKRGELPEIIIDHRDISADDGDIEALENPLGDFDRPWRKRKNRKEVQK